MKSDRVPNVITLHADASQLQLQAAEGDGDSKLRKFSGTAYTGIKMNAGGFSYPLVVDLSGVRVSKKSRPILRDHDFSKVVGHTEKVEVTPRTISVDGVISGANEHAQEIIGSSDNGFPWQMSIGANVGKVVFLEDGETASVNGRKVSGPAYIVRQSVLNEVSFVALGADDNTSAKVAASAAESSIGVIEMSFDEYLTEQGVEDGAALPEKLLKTLKAQFDASQKEPEEQPDNKLKATRKYASENFDSFVETQKKEQARIQKINAIASDMAAERPGQIDQIAALVQLAVEGDKSPDTFELELLRAVRPQTGGMFGRSKSQSMNNKTVEAALCRQGKLNNLEKNFDQQTLELAEKHFPHGIGLAELLLMTARENGHTGLSIHNTREVLEAAFRSHIRASGFSTLSLPGILSNVANKFLVDAFNAVESAWRQISAIRPVRDFKQIISYSLTGDMTYEKVGASGELKHATVGEETYTNQAETYGKIFGITRRDLINDDLGAFARIPQQLGRGGALAINEVFWLEFNTNSSFFTTMLGNYDDTAGTDFDEESLSNAEVLFSLLTDPDGKPLGSMPKILLVPPMFKVPAKRLMSSTILYRDSDDGGSNPWAGMFEVVSSVYLANTSLGGSATSWYLLADPNDLPVIETVFLGGRETPVIESADADFDTLGIQIRAYHDFGVKKQEYRGGVKMAGLAESTG